MILNKKPPATTPRGFLTFLINLNVSVYIELSSSVPNVVHPFRVFKELILQHKCNTILFKFQIDIS